MTTPVTPARPVSGTVAAPLLEPLAWLSMRQPRVPPAPLRTALREILAGLATSAAAAASARHRCLVAQVQRGQWGPRPAVVVAGAGGAGATSVATGMALVLTALWPGPAALADIQAGVLPLRPRLAGRATLRVVDGVPWYATPRCGDLRRLLDQAADANEFVVVDAGDDTGPTADVAIRSAGRVVVATAGGADAVESVGAALGRVHRIAPRRAEEAVVAVVARQRGGFRRATAALRQRLPAGRVVAVPYDRGLAAGWPPEAGHWRPAVRDAYLALAGLAAGPGAAPDQEWS